MKLISINVQTGCVGTRALPAFQRWINSHNPDLILCQEASSRGREARYPPIKGYARLEPEDQSDKIGLHHVAFYVKESAFKPSVTIPDAKWAGRWQAVELDGICVHNVYLDASNYRKRIELLENLAIIRSDKPVILTGDFNQAIAKKDYESAAKSSDYFTQNASNAFRQLCEAASLYEVTEPSTSNVYTIERELQKTRFRCDLAFASTCLRDSKRISAVYEHGTRIRWDARWEPILDASTIWPFTDHSGIVLGVDRI